MMQTVMNPSLSQNNDIDDNNYAFHRSRSFRSLMEKIDKETELDICKHNRTRKKCQEIVPKLIDASIFADLDGLSVLSVEECRNRKKGSRRKSSGLKRQRRPKRRSYNSYFEQRSKLPNENEASQLRIKKSNDTLEEWTNKSSHEESWPDLNNRPCVEFYDFENGVAAFLTTF